MGKIHLDPTAGKEPQESTVSNQNGVPVIKLVLHRLDRLRISFNLF